MSANQAILLRRLNFVNNFPAEIWYCWGRLHKKKIQWQCSVSYPFSAVAIDPFNFIRAQKLPSKGVPSSPLLWSANIRPTQQKIFTCWKKTNEILQQCTFWSFPPLFGELLRRSTLWLTGALIWYPIININWISFKGYGRYKFKHQKSDKMLKVFAFQP